LLFTTTPSFAQSPTPTPEPPIYEVQPGDTLYAIAERFGTTVEAIVAANDIDDPSLIEVGQRLVIPTAEPERVPSAEPPPERRIHPVQAGDTLPALAFRYGTTVWTLRLENDLDLLGLLWPGQELVVPPPDAAHAGMLTYPTVSAAPAPVFQGQTLLVEVRGDGELELSARFLGQKLTFVGQDDRYWALAGVDPLTPPGAYAMSLEAVEARSGDYLTFQATFTVTEGTFPTLNIVVPASRQSLLDPGLVEAERKKVNAVFAGLGDTPLWTGTFGLPLAGELRITAPFGQRRSYNSGPVSSYHAGYDLGADRGTPVMAPITGTVALAEPLQVRGKAIILDHGLGVFSAFWHLSEIQVSAGEVVTPGQVVGLVGNTGLSTGPHLHWEMRVGGVPVDAMQWTQQTFP
jgi:murein DD-endopeptidase MepM/ murein hydrolase activator NlpD